MGSRTFFQFILISCLAGCGIHNFESKTATDTHTTDIEADVGPYHSKSNITTKYVSSYKRCLSHYSGYFNAEEICSERMEAARPYNPAAVCNEYDDDREAKIRCLQVWRQTYSPWYQGTYSQGYYDQGYEGYCNWPGCMAR